MERIKTILVTGGAGFIGSHMVDRLLKEGYAVIVVDNLSTGKKEHLNPSAKFYELDIQSPKLASVFKKEKPDVIFHYAAQIDVRASVADPLYDAKVNVLGTLNVLENCKECEVQKIIFSSTGGAIYGEAKIIPTPETYIPLPLSPYGISKLSVEHYLHYYSTVFNLPHVTLRFSNVYGPRQDSKGEAGVIAIFCDYMLSGRQPVIFGNGKQTRDFVFVEDIVDASMRALQKNTKGIFNVGTNKEISVNEVFQKLIKCMGIRVKNLYGPSRKGEQKRSCLSNAKIKKVLGWKQRVSFEDGLRKTVEWYKTKTV